MKRTAAAVERSGLPPLESLSCAQTSSTHCCGNGWTGYSIQPERWEPTAKDILKLLARHDTIAAKATRRLLRAWVRALRRGRESEDRREEVEYKLSQCVDDYWAEKDAAGEKRANWRAEAARLSKELAEERGRSATLACVWRSTALPSVKSDLWPVRIINAVLAKDKCTRNE